MNGAATLALVAAPLTVFAETALTDPTRPPGAAFVTTPSDDPVAADASRLELHAVLYAEGRRLAIVNGRRVREGDSIAGARVVAIGQDRVRLARGDEDLLLEIASRPVKRPHDPGSSPKAWIGPPPPAAPDVQDAPDARDAKADVVRDTDSDAALPPNAQRGGSGGRADDGGARDGADVERGKTR